MSDKEHETQIILNLIADWRTAIEERDLDRLLSNYHPSVVLFDCKPPQQRIGVQAIRDCWEQCLSFFPERFTSEHKDLQVTVEGNLAFVHGFHRFVAITDTEQWADSFTWLRITVCYQKVDGKWFVIHEHVSIPFEPATGRIAPFELK